MRLSPLHTALTAVVVLSLGLGAAWFVLRPAGPVLIAARFGAAEISPNADGVSDIVRIEYSLARPATVSIYLLNAQGDRFTFRGEKPRESGEHSLLFSGVVDPFQLSEDTHESAVVARVLPNGEYNWVIEALEPGKDPEKVTGSLTVLEADADLPDLQNLTASPSVFTPNQDGLSDRATINVWLSKEVPDNGLHVTLVGPGGENYSIAEGESSILPGRPGLHTYDYDGGIDQGVNPPPDGRYTVRAEAEDAVGQKTRAEATISIRNSGLPRAEIVNGEVKFSSATVVAGDTVSFSLTVENYGTAPIRTFGPWSGTVYQQTENSNTLGHYEQDGAWRVGIDCDSCIRDYPWRWGVGTPETLTPMTDEDGVTQYYLMPGERAVITGGIVLTEIVESRNPQYFWAGLIHEAVGISNVNNRVDPFQITIVPRE